MNDELKTVIFIITSVLTVGLTALKILEFFQSRRGDILPLPQVPLQSLACQYQHTGIADTLVRIEHQQKEIIDMQREISQTLHDTAETLRRIMERLTDGKG